MPPTLTDAQVLLAGDQEALGRIRANLLKPLKNNFVERPWGGMRIREFKGLCALPDQLAVTGLGLGEAFEIAAYGEDAEAREHPSRLRLEDGSELTLAELLERHAESLLGERFTARFGSRLPLLPKILDIKELLSVQGHPEGNTEVYIIIEADPGATIRLGFSEDIDAAEFTRALIAGRRRQAALLSALTGDLDPSTLHGILSPWMANRHGGVEALERTLRGWLSRPHEWAEVADLLNALKALYWQVLDTMNAIPVRPGQVIHNANPARVVTGTGKAPSAEVHALGNPEGREILALEIRRPGPTFRAWDNVRFPIREVDVEAAVAALNLERTAPEEFLIEPEPVAERRGMLRSVISEAFHIEHLRPQGGVPVSVPAEPPHCLHAIRGGARIVDGGGRLIGDLHQGESAMVPIGVGEYQVESQAPDTEIVKVSLPLRA